MILNLFFFLFLIAFPIVNLNWFMKHSLLWISVTQHTPGFLLLLPFFFFFLLLLLSTATGSSFPMWTLILKAEVFPRLDHPYTQIITFAQITYKRVPQLKILEDT